MNKSKGKNSKGHPSKNSFDGVLQRIGDTAEICSDLQANKTARENVTKVLSTQIKTGELTKEDLIRRIADTQALLKEYTQQLKALKEQESALKSTGTDGK